VRFWPACWQNEVVSRLLVAPCLQVKRPSQEQHNQDDEQNAAQANARSAVAAIGGMSAHPKAAAEKQKSQDDEDDE